MSATLASNQIGLFLLVLARVSGLLLSAPVLGDMQVPRMVKVALTLALTFVLAQLSVVAHTAVPADTLPYILDMLAQLVVGIGMGLVARTVFLAVQTAGGIVSLQIGLTVSAVYNPLTKQPDSPVSQLYTIVASMTFLAIHGDLWLIAALARSFDLAPLTTAAFSVTLLGSVISDFMAITSMGLQIALPIAGSLLVANLVLGVVSRSLPQLNLFVLNMPLNMLMGLVGLTGSLTGLVIVLSHMMNNTPGAMLGLLPRLP